MSKKIDLDKYYTNLDTARLCIDVTIDKIGLVNISEWVEPSAGNGSFSLQLDNCLSYDIQPEHDSIKKQDFLTIDMQYKKGRCFIGNPPFGSRMSLAQQFFKKAIALGDYVAFVLPISQLWNTNSLFEFDMIHSQDLGKINYSDRKIHCCFNIYKRPSGGLNTKKKNTIEGIKIVRQDSKKYKDFEYDTRMCYWGSAGKILKDGQNYSGEYKIKITHKDKYKIIDLLNNINWRNELNCVAMPKIQQFHILNVIRKYIIENTVVEKELKIQEVLNDSIR